MDVEIKAKHEELENNIQEILREIEESNSRLNKGLIDQRSYENRKLHMKKLLAKVQRKLDELE